MVALVERPGDRHALPSRVLRQHVTDVISRERDLAGALAFGNEDRHARDEAMAGKLE